MTHNPDLHTALQKLNREAYAAARAAKAAGEIELHTELRNICWQTDAQVDAAAPSAEVKS